VKEDKNKFVLDEKYRRFGPGLGVAIGVSLGISFGVVFGNVAVGLVIGIIIGVVMGPAIFKATKNRKEPTDQNGDADDDNQY